jgi:hypothetical protein
MLLTLVVCPKSADRGLYRHQRDQGHLIPTNPTGPMENVISGAPILTTMRECGSSSAQ